MQIRWTSPAFNDFREISTYIEKKSGLATANKICQALYGAIQTLQTHPHLGKPGKRQSTRELVEGKYVIVYRLQSHSIEILRIWHAAQDRI
jgi:plasmid stabilization system protein ParE